MNDILARVRLVVDETKLSDTAFAAKIGLNQSTFSNLFQRGTIPRADVISAITNVFGIDSNWILTGRGEMHLRPEIVLSTVESNDSSDAIQLRGRHVIPMSLSSEDSDIVLVPFYNSKVSAGPGHDIAEYQTTRPIPIITSFLAPYNPATVRALKVKGDSMTKIGLFDEDVVFFVPIDDPGDGVYVLSINDKLLVKRVEFDPFGAEISIISENERYAPRVLKGADMEAVKIEGKVIGWLHKHPY